MCAALITLDDVHLAFGHHPLLDRAQLAILVGERIGLIGRNGAGKSSLLRVLAGDLPPDDGEVVRAGGLRIAMVAQEPDLDPAQTVLDSMVSDHAAQEDWQRPARAKRLIDALGLEAHALTGTLSGGTRKRVALARALVSEPDLLLLDEPTNHLDFDGIAWLEAMLCNARFSMVVITHDRRFLDAVATRIIELDRGQLFSFPGNFSAWQTRKTEWLAAQAQQHAKFDKVLAQEEAWIRQGIEARRTRNEGRVRRLQALRHARAQRREQSGSVRLALDHGKRSGKLVAELRNVSHQVGERVLVRDLTLTILRGDRIGVIGPNGVGKTTLLNLIMGRVPPSSGTVRLGTNLAVAYFDQMRAVLDENATVADTISPGGEWVEIGAQRKHVMRYLEDFLFAPERARSPVYSLSGGERARLVLARLFARPVNMLVMDEPTNDLDIETLELLEERLQDYDGTVLLVSHDRAFLDNVVTQTLSADASGGWRECVGGYDEWLAQQCATGGGTPARDGASSPARRAAPPLQVSSGAAAVQDAATLPVRAKPARAGRITPWEVRELERLPDDIAALERQQEAVMRQLGEGALYRDQPDQAAALQAQWQQWEQQLQALYTRWQELEAKQEGGVQESGHPGG